MNVHKLMKKKEHEKVAKKKVLARRERLRAPKIEENKLEKKMKKLGKLQKDIEGLNQWSDEVLLDLDESTSSQLQKNMKILRALEEEHKTSNEKKQRLLEELNAKNLPTMQEKIDFLAQINKPKREQIAEISVCKAPGFEEENQDIS